jgi:hypothetical protein
MITCTDLPMSVPLILLCGQCWLGSAASALAGAAVPAVHLPAQHHAVAQVLISDWSTGLEVFVRRMRNSPDRVPYYVPVTSRL